MDGFHESAVIGNNTTFGPFVVIGKDVRIGTGCVFGSHVVIHDGVQIGDNVRVDDYCSIGKQPMRSANSAVTLDKMQPPTHVGDRCILGTGAVIYAGSVLSEAVLVADLATVREEVTIGRATIIGRGVAVENGCSVGEYCKLETNAYLTAYSVLEDRVFIAPGVLTSNDNFIGRTKERFEYFKGITVRKGGRLGVGAVVLPGKEVGEDAVVAAGAVLTTDAESRTIYAGIPARPLRSVPENQLLENQ